MSKARIAALEAEVQNIRAETTAVQIALKVCIAFLPPTTLEALKKASEHASEAGLGLPFTDAQLNAIQTVLEVMASAPSDLKQWQYEKGRRSLN